MHTEVSPDISPWRLRTSLLLMGTLMVYLSVRYTQLLPWLGVWMPPVITGVVPGWPGLAAVGVFGGLGLWLLRRRRVPGLRWVWIGGLLLAGALVLSTYHYRPHNDEERDYDVTRTLSTYGIAQYWGVPEGMPDDEIQLLRTQQRLHPPLNTALGGLLLSPRVSLPGLRLFWLLLPAMGGLLLLRLGRKEVASLAWVAGAALLFCFPHFRNYMLIRAGNDVFGFVGLGAWVLLHLPLLRGQLKLSWGRWLGLIAVLSLAVWGKFSSLVAVSAWLGALGLGVLLGRRLWLRVALADGAAFLVVLLLYGLVWWGSPMLEEQGRHYGRYAARLGIELSPLPAPVLSAVETSSTPMAQLNAYQHRPDDWYPRARLLGTAVRLPFWLGPWLGGLLLLAVYSRWRHPDRWPPWERLMGSWVALGCLGVALVEPAIHYTAPLTVGMLWLGLHAWRVEGKERAADLRLIALMTLFALTGTLMPVWASMLGE